MYCSRCGQQSPDNFTSCAYCGAPFKTKKRRTAQRFKVKNKRLPFMTSAKKSVFIVIAAAVIVIASVITGILTGSKPDSVIKTAAEATVKNDAALYCSIFDEYYTEYCKQNKYFADDETRAALSEPMVKSDAFYKAECGDKYTLSCKVRSVEYFSDTRLEELNSELALTYGYKKNISDAACLDVEINAKGAGGVYTTVYKNYYCIKLGGRWYKCDIVQQ